MSDEDTEYGLVYPFIVCQSKGGPYDDESFVAGAYFGSLMAAFEIAEDVSLMEPVTVPTAIVPQIDLLAMNNHYVMHSAASEELPEWSAVSFVRFEENPGDSDD